MPRSSRHKSSKHSSRDARDYSDSEKDSSLKERKVKEESSSRVPKESSADKRKLDSKDAKDAYGTGNGDYSDEYGSSKKRKEQAVDDGVSDRWNGGEEDRGEGSRKSKTSGDSKSKRKEESEGKNRESSRKDRESGGEREKKRKEGKSDRLADNEEERSAKQVKEITDSRAGDHEPENQLERRIRRRRDGSGDGNKHLDDVGDTIDKRLSSKDDIFKDGKLKDEKPKDERYKGKYQENLNWDSKHRDEKQRDERPTKDHTSSRSDEKHLRHDKDMTENRPKKSKPLDQDRDQDTDREHDLDPSHDRVHDRYQDCESERDRDRDRGRNRNRDHDRDDDRDWDQDRDRDRDRDKERERGRDRERNRDRDRDRERDHDGSHFDDRSARYKDNRSRKRSPDDRDDFNDSKARIIKGHYSDMENKPLSSSRTESETERGRSQSRQVHVDSSSNRRRISPNSISHAGADEYKYRDSVTEHRSKFSGAAERSSKYRSMDKPIKMDDGHPGELSTERSSSSKASPMGLVEKSPSSTSVERRYMSRSGVGRNLDVEETGRRSSASIDARDFFATEDRLTQNLPLDKPLGDDSSQADSSFYNRNDENNTLVPPLPGFRASIDSSSYMGTLEDDRRFNSSTRYKRNGDSSLARGHGNAWRGVPSWSSPMPNGFMHFQHGPPHGGFQAMMPQFPSPLFGVRPSMEINHAGIPYPITDTDRFSGHLRPLGWQNMMDGSVPSHLHGWDGNNGAFRDEPHMYGAPDWDQNRDPMNRRGWEFSAEMWKGQNGDVNKDLPSSSQKEDFPMQVMEDEISAGHTGQKSQHQREHNHVGLNIRDVGARPSVTSATETSKSPLKVIKEKMSDPSKRSSYNDVARRSRVYISKLDISRALAYPELYSQCMRLLDMEEEATVDNSNMPINMKDGARVRLKVSPASQSSLSPTIMDTVFQRAMDLYKKQHIESRVVPISTGEVVDVKTVTNPQRGDDNIPKHNEGKTDEQVLISDVEMTDTLVSTCDEHKAEAVAATGIKEEAERILSLSPVKLEVAIEADNHEEPLPICISGTNDGMSSEVVKSEGGEKDCGFSGPIDSSHKDSILGVGDCGDGMMINGVKSNYDESGCSGLNGPLSSLCSSDGSSTSKALKPESNESVVLSRIHHSPESTH